MTIAEQELLPAVRRAGGDTLIIADGFSCREQIHHGAGRYALHPVEVLELALRDERVTAAREIERRLRQPPATVEPATAAALAGVAAIGCFVLWLGRRRSFGSERHTLHQV